MAHIANGRLARERRKARADARAQDTTLRLRDCGHKHTDSGARNCPVLNPEYVGKHHNFAD